MLIITKLHRLLIVGEFYEKMGAFPPCLSQTATSNPPCAECFVLQCIIHLMLYRIYNLERCVPVCAFKIGFKFQCSRPQDKGIWCNCDYPLDLLCQVGSADEQRNRNEMSCRIRYIFNWCASKKRIFILNWHLRVIDESVKYINWMREE